MELFSREFGAGAPLIILHGLFGFSDNWQTIAKKLGDECLVITPDLRNHGRSPHVPTHSYPEMAADLKAFLEARWIFNTDLIGHSMGGKVAMQTALNYPDLIDRLVVIDIDPGKADDNQSSIFEALVSMDLSKMASRQDAEAYLSDRIHDYGTRQFLLKNITREENGTFTWKMNLPVLWKHYPNILAPVTGEPFEKPTLFVRGERSTYIKDAEIPFIKSLFPNAQVVTIEGAGHWVHADQPAALLEVLRDFFNMS